MALTQVFCDLDLVTGANDGTSKADAYQDLDVLIAGDYALGTGVHVKIDSRGGVHTTALDGNKIWNASGDNVIIVQGWNFDDDVAEEVQINMQSGQFQITGRCQHFSYMEIEAAGSFAGKLTPLLIPSTTHNVSLYRISTIHSAFVGPNQGMDIHNCKVRECKVRSANGNLNVGIRAQGSSIVGCDIAGTVGIEFDVRDSAMDIRDNRIRCAGTTRRGILISGANINKESLIIAGNSIYDADSGIYIDTGVAWGILDDNFLSIENNAIWVTAGGTGINNTSVTGEPTTGLWNNAIGAPSGLVRKVGLDDTPDINPITLTADPWTDAANFDWSLNSAAGGGALLRAAALPADLSLDGTQDNFMDVGATQEECVAAPAVPETSSSSSSSSSAQAADAPSSSSSSEVPLPSVSSSSSSAGPVSPIFPAGTTPEARLQTPSAVCSIGMRPQFMTGALEQLLFDHFCDYTHIENPILRQKLETLRPVQILDETGETPPGGMLITSATKWQPQTAEQRPAVILRRNDWQWESQIIDDRIMGDRTPDQFERYIGWWRGSHTFFAIGRSGAEAEILGSEVAKIMVWYHEQIREAFNLARFRLVGVGAQVEIEEAEEHYAVPITVAYRGEEMWTMHQNVPRLKSINVSLAKVLRC